MRKLMRLVVTDGYGKTAEVPGYFPGGKTGTAEKVGAHGYKKHANVAAFTSVFPMNAPRYAVYMMLDEPHGNKSTYGYSTAGWVAAPAAGRVIARIAPMLGMLPDLQNAAAIQASLSIPLQPGRPSGALARGPGSAGAKIQAVAKPGEPKAGEPKPGLAVPATALPPAGMPAKPLSRDSHHQAALLPAVPRGASVMAASASLPSGGAAGAAR